MLSLLWIFGTRAWACEANSAVVINEFLPDPSGTDTDHEWVEIYNGAGVDVDISGWTLQGGASSYATFGSIPEGTILLSDSYFLIGDELVETDLGMVPDAVLSMSLGNASSNTDSIRITDCNDVVMDTVVYGNTWNTSDPWIDDLGNVPTSFAPKPSSGQTIARSPNGVDTNDAGVDFVLQDPSPKAENALVADGVCDATLGVVINEIMADPSGTDSGHEWIELYNGSGADVDVSGWVVQGGSSSYSFLGSFPEGMILLAGEYLLVGDELVEVDLGMVPDVVLSMSLGNAGSNADSVRITDCIDQVIDTVVYGNQLNENDAWIDDLGNIPTSFAPKPSSGQTIARSPNGVDTNDAGIDFVLQDPSPKAENIVSSDGGGGEIVCDSTMGVVINEFVADPAGSDTDREWIELYNASGVDVDISGWELQGGASTYSSIGAIPEGMILLAGEYLLVGDELVEDDLGMVPDVVLSMSLGNAGSNADSIRITDCNQQVMDTIIYGDSFNGTDPWVDDQGNLPDFFAPKPSSGQSTGRVPNGVDTDMLADDFQLLQFVSPKQPNDVVQTCDGEEVIKINEFLPNPEGDDATFEWVELYNTSSVEVDLAGWSLQWGTSSYGSSFVIPEGLIPANGYILIGGEGVLDADIMVPADNDLSMGSASSSGDALRLLHCGPGISDTVIYGPTSDEGTAENTDEWQEDDGLVATSIAPKATSGISISRRIDGVDSDISGEDFMLSIENTPGEANPEVQCNEGLGFIKINEIFPNPDGSDSGSEWIELYNTGVEAIRIDSWTIETASSSWSTRYTFPPETTIEPGAFFLLGEEDVPSEFADLTIESTLSLGNASTGFDGVRIKDCPGNSVDTIIYGKEGAYASEEEVLFVDDAGGETVTIFPDSGLSIGRFPDGDDSDDNSVDFQSNMEPTPKAANLENTAEEGDTGEIDIPQKGCSREPSEDGGPSKCSYVYGIPNSAWFAVLFVLYRRRETKH